MIFDEWMNKEFEIECQKVFEINSNEKLILDFTIVFDSKAPHFIESTKNIKGFYYIQIIYQSFHFEA